MENKIKNAIQLTEQLLEMAQFMDKENHKTPDGYHLQPLGVSAFSFHLGNLLELLRGIAAEFCEQHGSGDLDISIKETKAVAEIKMTDKTVLLFEVPAATRVNQMSQLKESLQSVFGEGRIALLCGATLRGAIHLSGDE